MKVLLNNNRNKISRSISIKNKNKEKDNDKDKDKDKKNFNLIKNKIQFYNNLHLYFLCLFLIVIIQIKTINSITTKYSFENLFKNKLTENCDDFLTCESCLQKGNRCGWCLSDGLCKSGNQIGSTSSNNFCPFLSWDTIKCQQKKCDFFNNQLACMTNSECFWCENIDENQRVMGTCENIDKKFNAKCKQKYTIVEYFENPKFYKSKNINDLLNEELKQLSTLKMYTNKSENKEKLDAKFLKYKDFLSTLKIYMKTNIVKRPPIYNGLNNPAGIYKYQMEILNENKNNEPEKSSNKIKDITNVKLDLSNFNSTSFDILSQDAKIEMVEISKEIALEKLINMFKFIDNDSYFEKKKNIFNLKEYKILEKICAEKWISYLDKKKIKLNDLRVSIGFFKDIDSEEEVNRIVEKVKKNLKKFIIK
jgi:hypothetical protein